MEPQSNLNNPIEPTNKSHRILVLTFVILLTAGIIGGGVYYVLNQQMKKKDKLIMELQRKDSKKTETKKEEKKTTTDSATQKDETAGWKTYTNDGGYQIKYANDWTWTEHAQNNTGFYSKELNEWVKANPNIPYTATLNIKYKTVRMLSEELKQEFSTFNDYFSYLKNTMSTKFTETSFAGKPAKTAVEVGDGQFYTVYVLNGSVLYTLSMATDKNTTKEAWDNLDPTLRKVLDSFKLTL